MSDKIPNTFGDIEKQMDKSDQAKKAKRAVKGRRDAERIIRDADKEVSKSPLSKMRRLY